MKSSCFHLFKDRRWAKKLMERWYLLITEKLFFWTFRRWEIRSFFEPKCCWKDDICSVFLSFLWYFRTWKIWFFCAVYLELLIPETMKPLGITKNKITKRENVEIIYHLEITEVVLVHYNIVNRDYQHDWRVLYTFVPNKSFSQLFDISPEKVLNI